MYQVQIHQNVFQWIKDCKIRPEIININNNYVFIWNPSNCEWKCDKSCDVRQYLNYANCKCRKRLIDKIVEEFSENIDEVTITKIPLARDENKCKSSCTIYVALIRVIFTICIEIGTYPIYYKYMNQDKKTVPKYDYVYQATNY